MDESTDLSMGRQVAVAADEGHTHTIQDALIQVDKTQDRINDLSRLEQASIRQLRSGRRQGVWGSSPQPAVYKLAILDIQWISA